MCLTPKVPQPTEYQQSQTPTYRDGMMSRSRGRRSTILTGARGVSGNTTGGSVGGQSGGGMMPTAVAPRRTVLGG